MNISSVTSSIGMPYEVKDTIFKKQGSPHDSNSKEPGVIVEISKDSENVAKKVHLGKSNQNYREKIINGQSFDEVRLQRELLLERKLSPDMNYKFTLSAKVNRLNETDKEAKGKDYLSKEDKLDNIVEAYTSLYDEIVKGYESGTRVINVADECNEKGYRTLTMQEELTDLNNAYKSVINRTVAIIEQSEKVQI